ncbi:MalY/PatB family protein [Acidiferrobacter sp.]|uniref:MalY/PatB family protein n=1 Tax=Acidiferrobacter sp. TaxID=1872107 RepID=UPI00262A3D57|nr:PatB family C-S lyase [Acidiferrobacter sp.]
MEDFDTPIERRHTGSVKWDRYRDRDILPLWVADMDFASPDVIVRALHERVAHGVFGYGNAPRGLLEAILAYVQTHQGWSLRPEWIVWLPGLVSGLNLACRATGAAGDAVATLTPVYPPFLSAPRLASRELIAVSLVRRADRYVIDWDALEAAMTPRTRLFLLCNPHNPVGRVYQTQELERLGRLCERHDIVICADEIHAGLVLDATLRHQSIAALDSELARRTITLMAPSKTFNVPGLGFSFAVIPDLALREQFRATMKGIVPDVNVMGFAAALAAYRGAEPWRRSLIDYLRDNAQRTVNAVRTMPGLDITPVEATYLAWIDARGVGADNPQRFFERAGVGLSDGADFGAEGFVRLNFGCRRALLEEALARMRHAVEEGGGER